MRQYDTHICRPSLSDARHALRIVDMVTTQCPLVVSMLILLTYSAAGESADRSSSQESSVEHTRAELPDFNVCGVNSLFVFLRLWGHPVRGADVERVTPRGPRGTSMAELQNAARELGVETSLLECNLEDLGTRCPLPAIALFRPGGQAAAAPVEYPGHYVVVLAVDERTVTWIDGTVGVQLRKTRADFSGRWRGFVLAHLAGSEVPLDSTLFSSLKSPVTWILTQGVLWIFLLRRRRSRRRAFRGLSAVESLER